VFLSREELLKSLKFIAWFGAVLIVTVAVFVAFASDAWKQQALYESIGFEFKPEEFAGMIQPYEREQFLLATDSYSSSAIIFDRYGKNFTVFGDGSRQALQNDTITELSRYSGRNVLILLESEPDLMQFIPYFKTVESRQFRLHGATFYLVLGYGFDYPFYRDNVL
jgi:hypothetical protein